MKIVATLIIKIETELDDSPENNDETVRFLVEEDLSELGYIVHKCEIGEGRNVGAGVAAIEAAEGIG